MYHMYSDSFFIHYQQKKNQLAPIRRCENRYFYQQNVRVNVAVYDLHVVAILYFQKEDTYAYYLNAERDAAYDYGLTASIPVELRPEALQFVAEDFGTELTYSIACVAKGGNAGKVDRLINEMVLAIKTRLGLTTKLLKAYDQMASYKK